MNGHGQANSSFLHDENGDTMIATSISPTKGSDSGISDIKSGSNDSIIRSSDDEIQNSFMGSVQRSMKENPETVRWITNGFIHGLAVGFFAYATYHFAYSESQEYTISEVGKYCYGKCSFQWCDGYGMLMILYILAYAGLCYYQFIKPKYGRKIYKNILKPINKKTATVFSTRLPGVLLFLLIIIGIGVFLYFETRTAAQKLVALGTPLVFLALGVVFSSNRRLIPWRTVLTGICLQFVLGIVCIRWEVGRKIFECIGNKVGTFLSYSIEGCLFVFGARIVEEQVFAFAILPVIFFFSFFISMLYYMGVMQFIVMKLGWILQKCLGTTVCESVNAAANIFLGQSEAPLLIRPYLKRLTRSELHSIMVSGLATVSGTVLAAYMSFGAKPEHLITASVMAAPASLAWSKLYLPESEESLTKADNIQMEESTDTSILDAGCKGAAIAIEVILGIIANLVAFIAFIAFLNGVVDWLGYLVGVDDLSFEMILGKVFMPLAWILGVPWHECEYVAQVIATKTTINEFVAYQRLGTLKDVISARSFGISTFAICGFANPSSVGIVIGTLGTMAPESRGKITAVALRAFFVGSLVCFVSASFAGLLMQEDTLTRLSDVQNLNAKNITLV